MAWNVQPEYNVFYPNLAIKITPTIIMKMINGVMYQCFHKSLINGTKMQSAKIKSIKFMSVLPSCVYVDYQ